MESSTRVKKPVAAALLHGGASGPPKSMEHELRVTRIPALELSQREIDCWRYLQERDSRFASPFFSPEFTLLVAQSRKDVCVSIAESGMNLRGYLPFEDRRGKGGPAGSILSDYQGVVISSDAGWRAEDLIEKSGLDYWAFSLLIESQTPFRSYHQTTARSRCVSLQHGFADFLQVLKQRGSHAFHRWQAYTRRTSRELGPVRFEYHVSDPRELEALLHCKSAQYKRSGAIDIFELGWTRDLLARIHAWQEESFAGVLSVLYAGDQAIAWHLG